MNWVEIDWEGESFSFALTDLCHQIGGLSKGGITRPKQWKDKKTQTMTMTMAMTMTAMSALMMIAMTMAQWFNETACRSWSFVTWSHFPNLQTSNLSVDSHSSSAWWGWWAEGPWWGWGWWWWWGSSRWHPSDVSSFPWIVAETMRPKDGCSVVGIHPNRQYPNGQNPKWCVGILSGSLSPTLSSFIPISVQWKSESVINLPTNSLG